ncbi:unnamed protein product [Amoebophrya sp. A120]|nr:unnamed protein product [Amoebophrya sp. A120]|eukprot:GSA120T00002551001.1
MSLELPGKDKFFILLRGISGVGKTKLGRDICAALSSTVKCVHVSNDFYFEETGMPWSFGAVQFQAIPDVRRKVQQAVKDRARVIICDNWNLKTPGGDGWSGDALGELWDLTVRDGGYQPIVVEFNLSSLKEAEAAVARNHRPGMETPQKIARKNWMVMGHLPDDWDEAVPDDCYIEVEKMNRDEKLARQILDLMGAVAPKKKTPRTKQASRSAEAKTPKKSTKSRSKSSAATPKTTKKAKATRKNKK